MAPIADYQTVIKPSFDALLTLGCTSEYYFDVTIELNIVDCCRNSIFNYKLQFNQKKK